MPKVIIVGGVAGGMSCAARLRRLDEKSEIVIYERGEYISYANCGLPYYIGGEIQDRSMLLVETAEAFSLRFNAQVYTRHEVTAIDPAKKTVTVKNLATGKSKTEKYDKLVLSPGAEPVRPPIPGIDHRLIFTLRNIPDTDRIKAYVTENRPRRAMIIGAGFIGLEMAESLHRLGIFVTIVEMANQVMNVLDYEMAAAVHQHLKTKGVEFYLSDGVSSFHDLDGKVKVKLNSGRELDVDMVILSIGVKPDSAVAKAAGLATGERGAISVNEYMQTSDPHIYAVGDAVEVHNPIIGRKVLLPLGGPANKQGRLTADNIIRGNKTKYSGVIGTAIAKVFDLTVASTGASQKLLEHCKVPFVASITHSSSHAGYYPNALPMIVKLLFSPKDGRVLGSQIVGYEGVDKRIDVLAASIKEDSTVYDLVEIEHAYAPPYSSAKDPINIAGYVASNILEQQSRIIHWNEIAKQDSDDVVFLDVRTTEECKLGMIPGAVNIPIDELRKRIKEVPKNKKIIVYCGVGLRGYLACRILYQNGIKEAYNLSGGYKILELATQKQDNGDIYEGYSIGLNDTIQQRLTPLTMTAQDNSRRLAVNACGLQCPGPIMQLKKVMDTLKGGDQVDISATDPGFYHDVQAWAKATGNRMVELSQDKGIIRAILEKDTGLQPAQGPLGSLSKDITQIVFDDDLDKAIAAFIIANGALSMGRKVSMFFTFWGLNILKKHTKTRGLKKNLIETMFGWMLPRGSKKLKLSQMNMMGIGPKMIRGLMKSKGVDSLEDMIRHAIQNGAEIIACNMSMDLMGIKAEELIEGVKFGGVATYLEAAGNANTSLFL